MSIKRLSALLYWLLLLPLITLPAILVFYLFSIDSFKQLLFESIEFTIQWQTVETWQLYLLSAFAALPSLILMWGLVHLRRTFKAFASGIIFELDNVQNVKRFAFALLLVPLLNTLVNTASSLLLSINHPEGQKVLSISINSDDVYTFLIGLIFWLIAKILVQATTLSKENEEFV